MARKRQLYRVFIERMEMALSSGGPFEASWYAYAILEDRLISLLKSSGGVRLTKGKPLKMMGPKLRELNSRVAAGDTLLKAHFNYDGIDSWKERRNNLMHAMADGSLELADIDKQAISLAADGAKLVREVTAAAQRLKRHADNRKSKLRSRRK